MTEAQFLLLLQGFRDRRLSEEDLRAFVEASGEPRFEAMLGESLLDELSRLEVEGIRDEQRAQKVWENVCVSITNPAAGSGVQADQPAALPARIIRLKPRVWLRYAVAVLLIAGIAGYLYISNRKETENQFVKADIAPGREGAILTLADGTRVVLDSLGNGKVAEQNGVKVMLQDGVLAYNPNDAGSVVYNTMSTPNGRQFSVRLPDGTRAWLNAASSITYPTVFAGKDRKVSITGEVYFEVVKDASRPFRVSVNEQTGVEVLGTSFNVSAYSSNASVNTTLLEGSVKVSAGSEMQLLRPGQQSLVTGTSIKLNTHADLQKTMAWKNGIFDFQDESLQEVMRQLARWYDIEVKYIGSPPKQQFFGELQRDLTLEQVLETLREVGIRFTIEGRTVLVAP